MYNFFLIKTLVTDLHLLLLKRELYVFACLMFALNKSEQNEGTRFTNTHSVCSCVPVFHVCSS